MTHLLAVVSGQHAPWLVMLAVAFCAVGSAITIRLVARAAMTRDASFDGWLFLAALCGGATVWCTHFIAMLAYRPGAPLAYDPLITILSLLVAVLGAALAFAVAARGRFAAAPEIGGALLGLSIAAMHYLGMSGLVGGVVAWNPAYVVASIVLGVGFAIPSLRGAVRPRPLWGTGAAALMFGAAVVTLHFTAMAAPILAASVHPAPEGVTSSGGLAVAVVVGGLLLIGAGLATHLIDDRSRAESDVRMRRLADASLEGIVVTAGDRVVEVNDAFLALAGQTRDGLVGRAFVAEFLPLLGASDRTAVKPTKLRTAEGGLIDVEVGVRDDRPEPGQRVFAIRDIRERLGQEQRIRDLVHSDPLTGLPNRARLDDFLRHEIDHAEGGGRKLAVLFTDITGFREINETHGHAAGDEVLRTIGARVAAMLRKPEFVARNAGDEFVALKPFRQHGEILEFTGRLERAMQAPIPFGETRVVAGAAIGVAVFPDDGQTRAALLNNADLALQRAKRLGTSAVCFYDPGLDGAMRARRRLARDLDLALDRGELTLYFQPQISLQGPSLQGVPSPVEAVGLPLIAGRRWTVSGYEALLRWRHPELGMVPPTEFIPIAEEVGLIAPIGDWVLRTACASAAAWPGPWKISVNLSPAQFAAGDLPARLAAILAESGLPPGRLEVEIGEAALPDGGADLLAALSAIRALGVGVALDGFGGGRASLTTLRAFRFDRIKLGRSFLVGLEMSEPARALVQAVLAFGRSLATPMLAEGVETAGQFAFLQAAGCEAMQGFLFGRPAPQEELALGRCSVSAGLAATGTDGRA